MGTLKTLGAFYGVGRYLQLPVGATRRGVGILGAAAAIAVAYFLTARLGLALLSAPSDVAVFWPASGIAAGILIISGRRARLALVIGVVVGTIAANILSDRSLLTSIFKGFCNAGEAVLLAWLVERWFGVFTFGDPRRVMGFLAAASLAIATSAVGGAATMTLLHTAAPFWEVWRTWFLSGGVGVLVVSPLLIGLAQSWRQRPSKGEMIEGVTVVGLLGLVTVYIVNCPTSSWVSFCLGAFVLPPLLWLAARCQPAFAFAGAFVVSIIAIWATIFGIGHFGDAAIPIDERTIGVQATVMMVTIYTLVLTALLTERRSREERLHRLLGALPAAIYTTDKAGRVTYCNPAAVELWGASPEPGKDKWSDLCRLRYPDGSVMPLDDYPAQICLTQGRAVRDREAILERPDGTRVPIIPCPAPLLDEQGAVAGFVSMKLDISERKRAELALAERNLQLSLAGKAALVGSFAYDVDTDKIQMSEGYAAIHGFPDGTTEIKRSDWLAGVHPEDRVRVEELRSRVFRHRWDEYSADYRIVCSSGEARWIEARCFVSYYGDGRPQRVVGVNIDATERKRTEEHQHTLLAELDHRVKNVLATVSAIITQAQKTDSSLADFVIALDARIKSLGRTHELLSHSRWHGVSLEEIVRRELAPYTAGNVAIGGTRTTLKADAAQALAMVLHELATNAAKYGAFSKQGGQLSLRWRWLRNGSHGRLVIEWQELGGPPVLAPSQSGYGTSIVRELIPFELGGTVDLDFAPDGLRCRLEIPADWCAPSGPTGQIELIAQEMASLKIGV
jgi:PAS domain S-box-containing protein